ncbi:DNA gyrase inhibitor YacG [Pelagibius sp. Alg239-R121]|uniref:DNA gyrase inhibitor YacG n=1 Tax=Pelagibius sp. Alg239-R121 TaxID=2993448 RepID=UPI0024A72601|nr:DNA gyrase inhibitor YacG [Pelagibius sp. Alg239-R121]
MSDESKQLKGTVEAVHAIKTAGRCPICEAPVEPKYRPFCSKRCADVDLGRWFKEGYRIPTDEAPGDSTFGDGDDY